MASVEQQRQWGREYYQRNPQRFRDYNRKQRERLRVVVAEAKRDRKCLFCPEENPCCLEFHHRDQAEKEIEIATLVGRSVSIRKLLAEIAKCILICSNCHKKVHAGREMVPFGDPKVSI